MKILFCDSTLNKNDVPLEIRKKYLFLSAIKRGDLVKLLEEYPIINEIIIVDGVFEQYPSITHKEILYAIKKKIRVVGISSIGALRAAELFQFGMLGSGKIFEAYLTEEVVSDEEVAVSYVKKNEKIYKTIPLINIRETISVNGLNPDILIQAKKIFYKERTWQRLAMALSQSDHKQLQDQYIDQKKQDVLNYLTTGRCLEEKSYKNQDLQVSSVYMKKNIIKYKYKTILDFIRERIKFVDNKKTEGLIDYQQVIYLIARFVDLDIIYASAIFNKLEEINQFEPSIQALSKFNRKLMKELNIDNKNELFNYIKKRNIPVESLNNLLKNIYKIYLLLVTNYNLYET